MLLIYLWYVKVKSICLINIHATKAYAVSHQYLGDGWRHVVNLTPHLVYPSVSSEWSARWVRDPGRIKTFGLCQESKHSSLIVQTAVKLLYWMNNSDLNIFVCRNAHQYKINCLKAMKIFKDYILLENNLNLLLKSHYIRRITFRNFDSCRLYGWQEIGLFVV